MQLSWRPIYKSEQPNVLVSNLQRAKRIVTPDERPSRILTSASHLFRSSNRLGIGVPHGVRNAIVLVRNLRIEWPTEEHPLLFFCASHDFEVADSTIRDGDSLPYPDLSKCFLSTAAMVPTDDTFVGARMRVSINGSLSIHIERFFPRQEFMSLNA